MEFDPKARIVICSAVEQQQVLIQVITTDAREKSLASIQKFLEGK